VISAAGAGTDKANKATPATAALVIHFLMSSSRSYPPIL
jgi:hypothetical protein